MGSGNYDYIGYLGLAINLMWMYQSSVFKLRVLSIIANVVYLAYGFFLQAPPLIIGCSIAISLHSYRLIKTKK